MSEKVLITRDESSITRTIKAVDNCLPFMQSVYDELSKFIKCDNLLPVKKVIDQRPNDIGSLTAIIKQMVVENMEDPTINGTKVSKNIIVDYIQIPDASLLFDAIVALQQSNGYADIKFSITRNYDLEGNSVVKFYDLNRVVSERNTFYTQNDKQVLFMEKAKAFLTSINELKPYIYFPHLMESLRDVEFLKWEGDNRIPTIDASFVQNLK
jgi:hypothetical protein